MKIILASSSPRRKELIENMGVEFETQTSEFEEIRNTKLKLKKQIEDLSFQKANVIFEKTTGQRLVIGSDTMVVMGKTVFGKPKTKEEAKYMLSKLSGKSHKIITGLCVIVEDENEKRVHMTHSLTKVYFKKLTEKEIDDYIETKEPMDKAGAYAIQGKSNVFIEKIKGDYFSVVDCQLTNYTTF